MKKKEKTTKSSAPDTGNVMGLRAEVLEQPITETLELNYTSNLSGQLEADHSVYRTSLPHN